MRTRFSSVEILHDGNDGRRQDLGAPAARDVDSSGPLSQSASSAHESAKAHAKAGQPEASRLLSANLLLNAAPATDEAAQLPLAASAPADPPDPLGSHATPSKAPAEMAEETLGPILADLTLVLPGLSVARARAVVLSLWIEGLCGRADIVDRAMGILLNEPAEDAPDAPGNEDEAGQDETSNGAVDRGIEPDAEAAGLNGSDPPPSPGSDSTTQLLLMLPDMSRLSYGRQSTSSSPEASP